MKRHCTSLEEILEPETHLDGQTSENKLESGNTRNMRHISTNIWMSNLVSITQTKTILISKENLENMLEESSSSADEGHSAG
jgi:hypothetical protein